MLPNLHFLRRLLWGLSTLALVAGCASSGSGSTAEAPGTAFKPFVYLDLQPGSLPFFREAVAKTVEKSQLARGFSFEPGDVDQADYRFRLGFEVRQDLITDPELIWATTTIMMFTVYPATCNSHHYTLTADLEDRAGNRIKSYVLHTSRRDFIWLFRAPDCGENPTDATMRRVGRSLLAELCRRVERDSLLKSTDATVPKPAGPLVYVSASRARDVIERATKVASPFPRYTFDLTLAERADFRIQVDLSVHGGNTGSVASILGRSALAIMTVSVVSICPATEIRLTATISDADQKELKSYTLSRKVRTDALLRGEQGQCKPHDEHTRAEVVDALMRKLYRLIAKDDLIKIALYSETSMEPRRSGWLREAFTDAASS